MVILIAAAQVKIPSNEIKRAERGLGMKQFPHCIKSNEGDTHVP